MPALKPIVWFLFKVLAIYLFFLAIPGEGVYAVLFRVVGNGVYARMGDGGRVRLVEGHTEKGEFDTRVTLINTKRAGARGTMDVTTRKTGYLPTAFTVALVAATPIPFRRRAMALAVALVLISCFVGFQFYLRLVDVLSGSDPLGVYKLGPLMKQAVSVLIRVLSLTPVTSYIAPVIVWAVLILRRDQPAHLAALCRGERPTVLSGRPARG